MNKAILFFVVYFWCNIFAGCDQYDLEYWKPDPLFALKHGYNRKTTRKSARRTTETTNSNKANFQNMRLVHHIPKYDENIWDSPLDQGNEARRLGVNDFLLDNSINGIVSTKQSSDSRLFRGTTIKFKTKNMTNTFNEEVVQRSRYQTKLALRSTRFNLMQQPEQTTTTRAPSKGKTTVETNDRYLNTYAIAEQLRQLVSRFEKDANITLEIIGRTAEYKDIVLLKLAEKIDSRHNASYKYFRSDDSKYMDEVPEKKIIFIVHGLTVLGINHVSYLSEVEDFEKLLRYYIEHLPRFDLFIIPMANPDGQTKTTQKNGWNKNNSPQTACPGVALDRNFDVAWNNTKVVSSCNYAYPGMRAFSEPETQAIRDLFHHYGHKIHAYIHVHPGSSDSSVFKGDAVLYPKGYTNIQGDDDRYIDMKGEIEEAMKNASFIFYSVTVDTLYQWYGQISGSSVDYASTVYGLPYALEFVMQPYDIDPSDCVLKESWSRIIGVVFDHAYKYLQREKNR